MGVVQSCLAALFDTDNLLEICLDQDYFGCDRITKGQIKCSLCCSTSPSFSSPYVSFIGFLMPFFVFQLTN